MKTVIRCTTLFDVTNTGISNRKAPINIPDDKIIEWEKNRGRQSNFDTIVQIISLRTQPEDITIPSKSLIDLSTTDKFGFLFDKEDEKSAWSFDFTIYYAGVYNDGINELGLLLQDADGVPMIKVGTEWDKLPNFLDTSPELKNINFEVLSNG